MRELLIWAQFVPFNSLLDNPLPVSPSRTAFSGDLTNFILTSHPSYLLDVLISSCDGTLNQMNISFSSLKSICIVLCSKGYPEKFENNIEIKDLGQLKLLENQNIFHAGTLKNKAGYVSNGGRVLNFVSISKDFSKCRAEVINLIKKLNWENGYFRKDIGYKVIKK